MSKNVKMEHKESESKNSKKQLVCASNRNPTQARSVGRLLNTKDHRDSCLKLLKFIADSDLTLTQVNGQRKLGPPPGWTGPPPSPKCEIFVGSIPRNYYEPEIVQIFSTAGRIYELRLMMDFSGTNRGYCFIMYATEEEAARAVRELDQFEIYPGKKIGVVASVNNRRLYMNHLPPDISTETIIKRIYEITDNIEKVAVYRSLDGMLNYVLVSYMTHRGAAMGRRRLVPESATLFPNCEVNVEWANPNISPWNVCEEIGTCDKDGKVDVETKFLLPVKSKNSVLRSKQPKILDKRWINPNRPQSCKSLDLSNRKTRAIKAAPENFKKTANCSSNCSFEPGPPKSLVWPNYSLTEIRNGYKGNLRNTVEQSSLYENLKNHVPHPSSMILPSISALLRKGRNAKSLKLNEPPKYSENIFNRQITANIPNTAYTGFNDYALNYCCQCDFYGHKHSILGSLNNYQSTNPSVDSLSPKVSAALIIPEEKDYKRQIVFASNDNSMRGNVNISNDQALLDANSQFVNHYQYNGYYQNYAVNGTEQNAASSISLNDRIPGQNLYNRGFVNQEPSREHLSQQFSSSNLQSVGWYPRMADNQSISCGSRNFPELPNGFYDYQVYSPQNARDAAYFDRKINDGSVSGTVANASDTFAWNNPVKPSVYANDGVFTRNRELFDTDEENCYANRL
nr:uncharacterized protein LOC116429129 [Nomia melanderi]